MDDNYEIGLQLALAQVEEEIILDATEIGQPDIVFSAAEHLAADMDGWDYIAAASAAAISVFIATNEDVEKWLAGVHDAANKQSGSYDFVQTALGKVFEHSGDVMDWFRTRDAEIRPDALFHRVFWGHDPLGIGPDNPFILMFKNNGIGGIFQAMRHLLADTFSKQGLPLPGHSFFEIPGDRPGNHLIDLVRELSKERYGNKLQAEAIYEHLLTIRAQDFAGGMVAAAIVSKYLGFIGGAKMRDFRFELRNAGFEHVQSRGLDNRFQPAACVFYQLAQANIAIQRRPGNVRDLSNGIKRNLSAVFADAGNGCHNALLCLAHNSPFPCLQRCHALLHLRNISCRAAAAYLGYFAGIQKTLQCAFHGGL